MTIYRGYEIVKNALGAYDVKEPKGFFVGPGDFRTEEFAQNWIDKEKRLDAIKC